MKIAFIGQKGIPAAGGGVERYAEDLAVRLVRLGHEVIVYTRPNYTDPNLREYQGVRLISLPSLGTKHLDAISHTFLASIDVLFRGADIIHYQNIGPALLSWLPAIFAPKAKIISTLQSKDYEHQKWGVFAQACLKLGEKFMCRFSDQVVVVTKSMIDYVLTQYNREAVLITNGANPLNQATGDEQIKQWGLAKDNYLVYVGRLVRHKGLSCLINAYQELATDKKLVIVGDGAFTDDYVDEIKTLAAGNPNVIFTGNQTGETLAQLYNNAYLFVQPSESEGLSMALLEAMARNTAVLVSDIAENLEPLVDGNFHFQNKNIQDLKKQLEILLANPETVKRSAQANQARVQELYNWDKIAAQMADLYQETINSDIKQVNFLSKILAKIS